MNATLSNIINCGFIVIHLFYNRKLVKRFVKKKEEAPAEDSEEFPATVKERSSPTLSTSAEVRDEWCDEFSSDDEQPLKRRIL